MKIDNIDNILNKEKSPDKAERSASIEELKKTQKFFDYNDLSNAATIKNDQLPIQEKDTNIFNYLTASNSVGGGGSSGSKLKKLLLNNDPQVANFSSSNEKVHNNSDYLNNSKNNYDSSSSSNIYSLSSVNSTNNYKNSINKSSNTGGILTKSSSKNELNATVASNNFLTSSKSISSQRNSNKKEINEKKNENNNTKKLFWCNQCKEYIFKLNLFNHMKSLHNKFTCLFCYGFFVKIEMLERHLARKHKVQNTTFFDEESLDNYFNANRNVYSEVENNEKRVSVVSTRVVRAVCCKCGAISEINEKSFRNHYCNEKSLSSIKEKNQELNLHPKESNINLAVRNDLNLNNNDNENNSTSSVKQNDTTKEDVFCEKVTHQWQQPQVTLNGASAISNEASSQNLVSSINDIDETASWHIEEQKLTNNNTEKLIVPKLTLKIPKAFQNQQYNAIDSEEDSGDEEENEDEEEQEEENIDDSVSEKSSKQKLSNSKNIYSSSSLSDSENEKYISRNQSINAQKRPENMPSLKLTIKNLTSTPIVLESSSRINHSSNSTVVNNDKIENQNDVDMTECPMDLEPIVNNDHDNHNEERKEPEPKKFFVDGIQITPAHEDILPLEIRLDEGLNTIPILKLMKICLRVSFPYCLYCNHARKIVVNGKGLAIHFITHHRFHAFVDSITAEELHTEKFNMKFEQSMEELQLCYFNLDTYDDHDEEKKEGHVTISHDKLYECFQCRFQTPIHKELYLHNRKMHQKLLINCLMCKMSFHSYSELLCHICPGVPNKQVFNDYKFYCCLCNMDNIPSAFRLMVHLRKKHYACDVCLEKCSDQSKLSSHVWKHKLLHICYRCHIFYQNKADIMKHLFWKHGTEGIECKKCLQKKWPHVYHFCIPPASFSCQHCEMSFSRAMSLKVHLRLHEDGAKYACTEIGCEKKFISKKLLIRHLERHQNEFAAQQKGDGEQERPEGTVIVPSDIPCGCCTRTMPVIFKRFIKKPAIRKIENNSKTEQTKEQSEPTLVEKKEEKDNKSLLDLPETRLNLSESSDSDSASSSDNDIDGKPAKKTSLNSSDIKPHLSTLNEQNDFQTNILVSETNTTEPLSPLNKVSTLSDSDDDNEIIENNKKTTDMIEDTNLSESLKNIKSSEESKIIKHDLESESIVKQINENDIIISSKEKNQEEEEEELKKDVEDKLPDKVILHVCRSDHDYAKLYRLTAETTEDDLEDIIKSATINKDKRKKVDPLKDEKSKAKTIDSKKKQSKNDDFSSSDSSSDGSSSDSSSGSSSESSSSSSSGSSSDSSSSEASSSTKTANKKPRNKKFTKKRSKKEKKAEVEIEEESPRDPDDIIYESDLQTEETDTDEDFYDEHPLKMNNQALTEKRKQLGNMDGIIENSRPSTPSLPPDEKIEKRMKIKKRKRDHKKSPSKRNVLESKSIVNADDDSISCHSNRMLLPETPQKLILNFKYSNLGQQGFMHTSTPIAPTPPRIELHQANQIRQLLQSTQQQPILPILLEQQQHIQPQYQNQMISNSNVNDYINVSHVSSAQSSRMNSDNEQSGIKRSQRRRIPNKFYGYTSDDDSMASLIQNPNDSFKPIPPPLLTWDKEDLPSRSKSPNPCQHTQPQIQQTQRVAPLKLIINGEQQQHQAKHFTSVDIHDKYDSSQIKDLPINLNMKNEDIVTHNHHLQEPPQSDSGNSDDDQLHISEPGRRKRKLPSQSMYAFHTLETPKTVPTSQPPIPRLKLTIGSNNKIRRRNINPLKPPAKKRKLISKSHNASSKIMTLTNNFSQNPYTKSTFDLSTQGTSSRLSTLDNIKTVTESRTQKHVLAKEKQQKLEEAILNTQQYFQRYNHAQVANDIPQDSTDNDGRVYCYCRRPYDDLQGMIGCDGPECEIEWFHFECVGILVPPKGNWFCPQCQKDQSSLTG